ncbi:MAG: LamG-like jellyroll fold domain-containing protein [Lentisphaeria bacterium]|jgi:hypothetical protein
MRTQLSCIVWVMTVVATAMLSAQVPARAGHWTFDGALTAQNGRGQDLYMANPEYAAGRSGQALRFSVAKTATIMDAPELRLAPGFRLACRVLLEKLPAGNSWATIAIKGRLSKGEYFLRVDPANEGQGFAFFISSEGRWEPRVRSNIKAEVGVWYDLEAGWDGKEIWLTVNGETTRTARQGDVKPSYAPVQLGDFDGLLDELSISSPMKSTSVGCWHFDGDLQDQSGLGHDFVSTGEARFLPAAAGQALELGTAEFSVPSNKDLQLAPGLRIACSVLFDEIPEAPTPIVLKENEYMLRVNPKVEGSNFAFFVFKNGRWEPRVSSKVKPQPGRWYHLVASWDGINQVIGVNGEVNNKVHSGLIEPGDAPLTLGTFKGQIDELLIENPRLAVIGISDLMTDNMLLRSGRQERLSGVIRNYGRPLSGCEVSLSLSDGVICESAATLTLGPLDSNAAVPVAWTLSSAESKSARATIRMVASDGTVETTPKVLAFLPETDPDFSARAWQPPLGKVASAPTYYVDAMDGDNAHDGTTPETAWRDFTPVNGRTLGPGERLLIRRGSVLRQELQLSAQGTADAWAEIGAYGEGPRPVIRRNWHINDRCVFIKDPDYLAIRGLTVCYAGIGLTVNYSRSGHRGLLIEDCIAHHIEGLYRFNAHGIPEWRDGRGAPGGVRGGIGFGGAQGEDIVFRDCEMFQCSAGFRASGWNVFIDRVFCHDNFTHNTSPHPYLVSVNRAYLVNSIFDAAGWHAHAGTMGIMLAGTNGLIIRNCHFLNQPDSGSHDQGGIDFEAGGDGNLIDRCTFRNNAGAAIEVLGLRSPQTRNVEITNSRFDRNNVAHKLGPAEIYIWGGSQDPIVCCSNGIIHNNGYVLYPGVSFYVNKAPTLTNWALADNTEFSSWEALDAAMPLNNPPAISMGPEIWTDQRQVTLKAEVKDDGRPADGQLRCVWEQIHGPGRVVFADAGASTTTAEFSAPGDYLLRLKADDGEHWRSAMTTVHILPAGSAVARAWSFATPQDKEGWSEANLGTKDEDFDAVTIMGCISRPVHHVGGGHYVLAVLESGDAHIVSADNLGEDLAANRCVGIRFMNSTPATRMRLRFTTDAAPEWSDQASQVFEVVPGDNETRLYTIDLSQNAAWRGTLKQLRLDFSHDGTPVTGSCRIDYLWIGRGR